MNNLLYLLQVNIYLVAFYAFYRVFLSRETFFSLNRFYLIGCALLAFSIPALQSEWLKNWLTPAPAQQMALQFNMQAYEFLYIAPTEVTLISLGDLLGWIYFSITGLLFIRFIYRLFKTYRWIKKPQSGLLACSFFNYIAIDEDLEGKEAIMVHEQVHVQQIHSADILFFELNAIINWFNPISYWLKGEIRKVHEYTADDAACKTLTEKSAYAMLLFHQNFGASEQKLTNSFFNQSILKQRIMMLQKNKSKKTALLKYGLSAPLFLGMMVISSAFVSEKTSESQQLLDQAIMTDTVPKNRAEQEIKTKSAQPELQRVLDSIPKERKLLPPIIAGKEPLYINNGKTVNIAYGGRSDIDNLVYTQIIRVPLSTKLFGEKGKYGVYISQFKEAGSETSSTIPLYIIDGKEIQKSEVENILPNNIQAINVLKDKTAIDKYGDKGKNGVVEITLKENQDNSIKDFASVDVMPEFPSGAAGWAQYLQSEMKYPAAAREKQVSGRVIVSFIIEKTGELTDIKVMRGISKELDEEALRVIGKSPKWIPGMSKGKAVRVAYTIPIFFQLASATK